MAAKEQLTAMEMIWGFMSGTTGHMGKTDFVPQKEAIRRYFITRAVFSARDAGKQGDFIGKADADDPGAFSGTPYGYASPSCPAERKGDL